MISVSYLGMVVIRLAYDLRFKCVGWVGMCYGLQQVWFVF